MIRQISKKAKLCGAATLKCVAGDALGPQCPIARGAWRRTRWLGVFAGLLQVLAWAHDPGLSTAQGELRADGLALITGFAPADVEALLPAGAPRAEKWGQTEFEAVREPLKVVAKRLWDARVGAKVLMPQEARVELLPGDNVSFSVVLGPLPDGEELTLRAARIPDLPAGHRQFVVISDKDGSVIAKKLMSARDFVIEVPLPANATPRDAGIAVEGKTAVAPGAAAARDLPSALGFIRLGIEHIWTGYDHLMFLFALLVVCRTFRSIVAIVTCFTLAHSLTLALATLNWVVLPTRVVEPLIAASILFVGAENLWSRGEEPRGRWAVTFAFGLVHGFGFASVLRDLGVGGGGYGILMPLLTFNLGVEIGQVAISALVLPGIWWLRRKPAFLARGVPAFSLLVAGAGLYWLVVRIVFA